MPFAYFDSGCLILRQNEKGAFMEDTRQESIKKLNGLIKDIKIAMLTTVDFGLLRARPMATQEAEFDGDLWFMTSSETHKTEEIQKDPRVSVTYAAPNTNTYVSVSGTAQIVSDHKKIEELWNPIYKAWFSERIGRPDDLFAESVGRAGGILGFTEFDARADRRIRQGDGHWSACRRRRSRQG